MKNLLTFTLLLLFCLSPFSKISAQDDIFKGIFDKEEPVFHSAILPTAENGTVRLALYFTHGKINSLEVSVWMKNQGSNLDGGGSRQLIRGLQQIDNRRQDTIFIDGLANLHFYTIGIDYRNPQGLARKFTSKVLYEGYRYMAPDAAVAARSGEVVQNPVLPLSTEKPESQMYPRSGGQLPTTPKVQPCQDPDISVRIEPSGYCGTENRPAVLIQCRDCHGENWEFSVEVRTESTFWRSLRSDGLRQSALGVGVRTEPLCLIPAGNYFIRVLAWGVNCQTPVVREVGTSVAIYDRGTTQMESWRSPSSSSSAPVLNPLPDTCAVKGYATLDGNMIRGALELAAGSPCGELRPFADVRYVHPGHRDLTAGQIALLPGRISPFEILLEEDDLTRGIHTIQVVSYVRPEASQETVAMGSFWIRAKTGATGFGESREIASNNTPVYTNPSGGVVLYPADNPYETQVPVGGGQMTTKSADGWNTSADKNFEDPLLSQDFETVQVTAGDPNCTQIQDLRLVFFSSKADQPLYISWLSPRCCQQDGCQYSIWAGKAPDQLRLLITGNKPGAMVKELLQDLMPGDVYFEVVVKTANGSRKAAYVVGEGPKYGFEEILAYHDRLKPPSSDTLVYRKEKAIAVGMPGPASQELQKPNLPIANFKPCKYKRETSIIGDLPVHADDEVKLKYDFSEKGYQYTLYFQPNGSGDWSLAPGTKELQSSPEFTLKAGPQHSGKYLVLAYKSNSNWGCLSAPVTEPVELKVVE
jgi:hypothetical protein